MSSQLDTEKLSNILKKKRGVMGLRALAEEIGEVSASTLSRIEKGNLPDVETFLRICNWLNVPPEFFNKKGKSEYSDTEKIAAHLRADKNLDSDTAEAIIQLIKVAYKKKFSE